MDERFKRMYLGEWPKAMSDNEEYKIKLEGELCFGDVRPDMTAFLNVSLPDSHDDMVDALAIQSLMINKPCWWVRFKYWFRRVFHLHP